MGCTASKPEGPLPAKAGWDLSKSEVLPKYETSKGPFFVTQPTEKRDIVYSQSGPGSEGENPPMTFHELFKLAADKKKDKPAFYAELPEPPLADDGSAPPPLPLDKWQTYTWGEYYNVCRTVAKAFISLGAEKFQGTMILGFNSPQWIISQIGSIIAGQLPAGIYPTDTAEQLAYKTKYADAAIACCGSKKDFDAFVAAIDEAPLLKAIISWSYEHGEAEVKRSDGSTVKILSWKQLVELGEKQSDEALDARIAGQDPRDCVALCFTSGTTGKPKAVMLSHDNLTWSARATIATIAGYGDGGQERSLSYLPLSHVAGLVVDITLPICCTALLEGWHSLYFARTYDLKAGSLGARLKFVKPTAFLGVPRVWEKVAAKLQALGAQTKGLKKKIVTFAKGKGLEYEQNKCLGGTGQKPSMYDWANKKVLNKIREALGLQECKIAISGAAPLSKELQEYFGSLGISINDSYGMSECGGATCANNNTTHQWGTVGGAIPGTEVRVFQVAETDINDKKEAKVAENIFAPAEDEQGELCYRGRHIMMGYWANPNLGPEHVEEITRKNAETIDNDGYLHSGDKGAVSQKGMFRVTGRYKELIIGAGGENIAPVPVEEGLKHKFAGISNAIMIGNKRRFNTMLITLRAVGATGEFPGGDDLDPDVVKFGSPGTTKISQAIKDKKWIEAISEAIKANNADGNVTQSNAWKVQKFTILPYDFSIVGGDLTPTLKTKRAVVDEKYNGLIDKLMESSDMYMEYDPAFVPPNPGNGTESETKAETAPIKTAVKAEEVVVVAEAAEAAEPAKTVEQGEAEAADTTKDASETTTEVAKE